MFIEEDESTLKEYAWFRENSGEGVHIVGSKKANMWGLHDVLGNVWEYTWDLFKELPDKHEVNPSGPLTEEIQLRVWRGGSWYTEASRTRIAFRWKREPNVVAGDLGIRIAKNYKNSRNKD